MSNGMNPIQTEADVERVSVAALSNEQIDDPMHSSPSEDEVENYDSDANFMLKIAKSRTKGLTASKSNCIYAKRIQARV